MTTGHREAENTAKQLRDAFGSRVHDDIAIPLGDVDYFRMQHAYIAKSSTNFLLDTIFKLSERIADLRHAVQAMQPKEIDEPKKCIESAEPSCDIVSHPSHYNVSGIECIDEMILAFGPETTKAFCVCNAWKYRYRAGHKDGSSRSDDLEKASRYMKYAKVIEKYKDPLSPCYSYLPVSTLANRHD